MDTALFLFMNAGLQNNILDSVMIFITNRGYLLFITIITPLIIKDWRKGILILVLSVCGFVIADNCSDFLKDIFAMPRPYQKLENVRLLVPTLRSFSFPSGHASTSFAMAYIIAYYHRRVAVPALIIAMLVGFSRIYVGVHYPSDVLAGAVLGIAIGWVIIMIQQKLRRHKGTGAQR